MRFHAKSDYEQLCVTYKADGDLVLVTRSQIGLLVEGAALLIDHSDTNHAQELAVLLGIKSNSS